MENSEIVIFPNSSWTLRSIFLIPIVSKGQNVTELSVTVTHDDAREKSSSYIPLASLS